MSNSKSFVICFVVHVWTFCPEGKGGLAKFQTGWVTFLFKFGHFSGRVKGVT